MAERRMFANTIVDSDAFLDMPLSTQALYFHLSMRADDEGFINNAKKVIRMIGCNDDEIKVLISKRFVIPFQSGVVVIKHWCINNTIRADRTRPTVHQAEKAMLQVKKNKAYTELSAYDNQLSTICQPTDNQMSAQNRLDKIRLDKIRLGGSTIPPKDIRHQYGQYENVLLNDADYEKLKAEFHDYQSRIERLSEYMASKGISYKNHLATIRSWAKKDKMGGKPISAKDDANKDYGTGEEGWS